MSPYSYMFYIEISYVKTIHAVIGDDLFNLFNDLGPEFASEWHQFWILAQS